MSGPAPHLITRADADEAIGSGHVMRALAVAQAWMAAGGSVDYVGRCASSSLLSRLRAAGCGVTEITQTHPSPSDIRRTLALSRPGSWLLADGYHFDADYLTEARAAGLRVALVDDYPDRQGLPSDMLVNPNPGAERRLHPTELPTLPLLGARYALLRPEYRARPAERAFAAQARRVLVSLGGSDPANLSAEAARALRRHAGIEAVIVLGPNNPHEKSIVEATSGAPHIRLERDADIRRLMEWAEVGVLSAGVTSLEAAFMGLPNLAVVAAENQIASADALVEAGAALRLDGAAGLSPALTALCADSGRREAMSRAGQALVDGRGAERVAASMLGLLTLRLEALNVRPAVLEDAHQVWSLANESEVRRRSFEKAPIPLETHLRWFSEELRRPSTRFWVLELAGTLVGQIRYVRAEDGTAEVHFAVRGAFRGKGLGTQLLTRTAPEACADLRARRLIGVVIPPNEASARAFLKAGYSRAGETRRRERLCEVFERTC